MFVERDKWKRLRWTFRKDWATKMKSCFNFVQINPSLIGWWRKKWHLTWEVVSGEGAVWVTKVRSNITVKVFGCIWKVHFFAHIKSSKVLLTFPLPLGTRRTLSDSYDKPYRSTDSTSKIKHQCWRRKAHLE